MPKVQCGVSVSPLPVKVSYAEGTLTGTIRPVYPHNRSTRVVSDLSLDVGCTPPERPGPKTWQDLFGPMGHALPKSAMRRDPPQSADETWPDLFGPMGPTHAKSAMRPSQMSPLPVKVFAKVTQSDETWQTCLARWATHAKSAMRRLSVTASGESVAEGDPERRNLADLFGPMGHACQKCNAAATKLGRLVWPDGPRMPKVQCGVSVSPLPVKVSPKVTQSDETWQTCLARWATHAKSAMRRLSVTASGESVAEGDPERRNLADLFGPMGHACQKCNAAATKLGRLVWPDGPRMPKVQCGVSVSPLPVKVSPKVTQSDETWQTCLARWATHAKSAMRRLSVTASGESVAEGDPERRNLADLFGPMGHACQKCNAAATKLGRLVWPDGPRMPKVQCGVSVSPLPVKVSPKVTQSDETWQTCLARWATHAKSAMRRLSVTASGESVAEGDPERRNLADLFGPMGHACQKCNAAATKLGRLVWPDGPRMPKVQCGVSVSPLPVKVSPKVTQSDETWQTCLARWATHAKSAMRRLSVTASGESVAEGDPERRNLADLFGPMGHACQKCNAAATKLGRLVWPDGPRMPKVQCGVSVSPLPVKVSPKVTQSDETWQTCLARWATHAKSAMRRLSVTASGESVAEGDPERRNLADLFGPMGHACQKCNAAATKLGRLVWPDGPRMPKVQCGVSVSPLPVKVSPKVTQSDETWQTCLARWATHAKSAMRRLSVTASGESVAEGDPERRNLADLFGPMGHACQKCNAAATKLGRLVWPDGPRMPKVQCGVSVSPLPVKVSPKVTQSDETWQTCLARWATHAKSAMRRLSVTASGESVAEGDPERRNLADLFGPMGHACQKCNAAATKLGRLVWPDGPRMPKVQCGVSVSPLPVKVSPKVTQSDETWQTCLARWATHAKSAMRRLSVTASGESVAEGDPERRNLADLFGPMGHACQKCNAASMDLVANGKASVALWLEYRTCNQKAPLRVSSKRGWTVSEFMRGSLPADLRKVDGSTQILERALMGS
ncbi:hypothetical protein DPMN_087921 [Dreissena polymorpha]|uniref:Uncharacterized protein n=1 Tax=Dreissena polymorpha TaxID=45954 RepID=A0A9D4QW17_DREPO|nr:hypothetical protein DPMN_087921 [Dreissena polymorpha]